GAETSVVDVGGDVLDPDPGRRTRRGESRHGRLLLSAFGLSNRCPVKFPRSSGVQLHPTSLPSGRLGADAYRFVDWLAAAGQSWWQMLPLGPPDRWGSPYKSPSAFAAWPGFLAEPGAPVSADEEAAFRERHA